MSMGRKRYVSFLLLLSVQCAQAVIHINGGEVYPKAARDKFRTIQRSAEGSLLPASLSSTTGTKKVAVIVVQFPAGNSSLISGNRSIVSPANINAYFTRMTAYYTEVSYGKITVDLHFFNSGVAAANGEATFTSPYTLAHPSEYYGCGDEGMGCNGVSTPAPGIRPNGDYLIKDALLAASAEHGGFPKNVTLGSGNGYFDAVIVMHAGNGNETTDKRNGDIWSIYYQDDTTSQVITSASLGFTEGDVVPETESIPITSPLGVMCHEFGHELGLPDLYNTTTGTTVVGEWELMDYGPYSGNGANPSHFGAWSKSALGWTTPQVVNSRGTYTLGKAETSATSFLKLPVQNGGPQEYFLVEYRSQTTAGATYDASIPGTGLLIWHIDDAITSTRGVLTTNTVNSGSPHYGATIVTRNGVTLSNADTGDANNVFIDRLNFITPTSDNFANRPSGISIVNIQGVGGTSVSLEVTNLALSAGQSISKVINYPNPAGKGYAHEQGEGHTTIQFQLTRPAQTYSINIYTLSGELVRQIKEDGIELKPIRSSDLKWVYEFIWDLKNGSGEHVAPGTYLYLVRADGESKTGKAVIIR